MDFQYLRGGEAIGLGQCQSIDHVLIISSLCENALLGWQSATSMLQRCTFYVMHTLALLEVSVELTATLTRLGRTKSELTVSYILLTNLVHSSPREERTILSSLTRQTKSDWRKMGQSHTIVWTMRLVHVESIRHPDRKQMMVGHAEPYLEKEAWLKDELKQFVVRA
jgi:hypothetical protein